MSTQPDNPNEVALTPMGALAPRADQIKFTIQPSPNPEQVPQWISAALKDYRVALSYIVEPISDNDRDALLAAQLARHAPQIPASEEARINVRHPKAHEACDAFWKYWQENGVPHEHGYYESTWGAINVALKICGVTQPAGESKVREALAGLLSATMEMDYAPDRFKKAEAGVRLIAARNVARAALSTPPPAATSAEGHKPHCDKLLAGQQTCNCGYDTTIAGLRSQVAALQGEVERLNGERTCFYLDVEAAIGRGRLLDAPKSAIKAIEEMRVQLASLQQRQGADEELMGHIKEFLQECETAEDRSNLDGDTAEAVLEQINDGAEELLTKLATVQSAPCASASRDSERPLWRPAAEFNSTKMQFVLVTDGDVVRLRLWNGRGWEDQPNDTPQFTHFMDTQSLPAATSPEPKKESA